MSKKTPQININPLSAFTSPAFQNEQWYREVGYEDAKDLIQENFKKAASSFIEIGYYLKHIKEKKLYEEGNYQSIWDFALEEFGLKQSMTSRYMKMCSVYSVNGDSPHLDKKYEDFSKSQLQEMLSLPESVIEEITPDMTVKEIRQINHEDKLEESENDIPEQMRIEDFPEVLPDNYDFSDTQSYATSHKDDLRIPVEEAEADVPEEVIDVVYSEVPSVIETKKEYPNSLSQVEVKCLQQHIEESAELLEAMGDYWKANQPETYEKYQVLKRACELMLQYGNQEIHHQYNQDLQPEMPILKNKVQREKFLENYQAWPVWITTPETGETYYRYNLSDGSSIVIRHCKERSIWEEGKEHDRTEKFLLEEGKYFRDCESNTTSLIEHLKNIQKL